MTDFRRWLARFQLSETIILLSREVVGLPTAIGVWVFKQLIDLTHLAEYSWLGGVIALSPFNWAGIHGAFGKVSSLRRGSESFIPSGGGLIKAGDVQVRTSDRSCEFEIVTLGISHEGQRTASSGNYGGKYASYHS